MTSRSRLRFFASLLIVVGCSEPSSQQASDPVAFDLEEIVRIGSITDGPEEYLLSVTMDLAVDPAARRVFVAEGSSREIRVFDYNGDFLFRIGRSGDGPGEFDSPPFFDVFRDTVVAADRSGVDVFQASGEHLATWRYDTSGSYPTAIAVAADDLGWKLRTREAVQTDDGNGLFYRAYRIDLDARTLGEPIGQAPVSGFGLFGEAPIFEFARNGFVMSDPVEYELDYASDVDSPDSLAFPFEPTAIDQNTIVRDWETFQRARCETVSDRERCLEFAERSISGRIASEIPSHRPVVGGVVAGPADQLLVGRADLDSTPFVLADFSRWDVVDLEGRVLGFMEFPAGFRPEWFGGDEVWGIQAEMFDVPVVVGYRLLERRGGGV